MPPVASTTAGARIAASAPSGVRASTPTTRPPKRTRSTSSWPSRISMSGRERTAPTSVRMTSAPVASPPACAMRRAECPASRPSARRPSASRSKRAPSPSSQSMRPAAASAIARATSASANPAETASVSRAWLAGVSSAPSAAAMPPCACGLEPLPRAPRVSTMQSPMPSAAERPAMPEPTTTARARRTSVIRPAASSMRAPYEWRRLAGLYLHREHSLDRGSCARGNSGIDVDDVLHVAQRVADVLESDTLHVRAKVAGTHELGVARLGRDVIAHRAFGDHHHLARLLPLDPGDHAGRRADVIGLLEHVGRALGMRDDPDAVVKPAVFAQLVAREALVHFAA